MTRGAPGNPGRCGKARAVPLRDGRGAVSVEGPRAGGRPVWGRTAGRWPRRKSRCRAEVASEGRRRCCTGGHRSPARGRASRHGRARGPACPPWSLWAPGNDFARPRELLCASLQSRGPRPRGHSPGRVRPARSGLGVPTECPRGARRADLQPPPPPPVALALALGRTPCWGLRAARLLGSGEAPGGG